MAKRQSTNHRIAWISMVLGAGSGLVMGLWSFDGPVPSPSWIGSYDDVSRRLIRLGHIAFFGLAILNLFVARELPRVTLGEAAKRAAARAMNFGNLFLPLTLFAAGLYHPLKYLMPIPAMSVFAALSLTAWGVWHTAESEHERA